MTIRFALVSIFLCVALGSCRSVAPLGLGSGDLRVSVEARRAHLALGEHDATLSLRRWGRATPSDALDAEPVRMGESVRVDRGGVVEWWRSVSRGLEHGLDIAARPAGEGALTFELALTGLTAEGRESIALRDGGEIVATYAGLHVLDADGIEVASRMWGEGSAIHIVVDDTAARYPLVVDPLVVMTEATVMAADGAVGDLFGFSVALSADGTIAAVGMPGDVTTAGGSAGSVRIFVRTGTSWAEQAVLVAPNASASDRFGQAVALSADGAHLIVGAPFDDVMDVSVVLMDAGSAFYFARTGTTWSSGTTVGGIVGASASDQFGTAVAISADGTRAAIGAPYRDGPAADAGLVQVVRRSGASWAVEATLVPSDATVQELFGEALALTADGSRLLVGMPHDDNGFGNNVGSVRVYARAGTAWSAESTFGAPDADDADQFGYSVAIDADATRAVVGVLFDDTSRGMLDGSARVFVRTGTSWSQETVLDVGAASPTTAERIGGAAALSTDGSLALVGNAWWDGSGQGQGGEPRLRIYVRSGTSWTLDQNILAPLGQTHFTFAIDGAGVRALSSSPFPGFGSPGRVNVLRLTRALGATCGTAEGCASGFCADGVCCNTACGGSSATDCQACSAALTGGASGTCAGLSASVAPTTICSAATVCAAAASCVAGNTVCPANAPLPATTVCRASVGLCDAEETCTGATSACPADAPHPAGFVCRASTGECDPSETCNGTATSCPGDVLQPNGTLCGLSATSCTTGGSCNGTSGACIGGTPLPATHVCLGAAPGNGCDRDDHCNGAGVCVPEYASVTDLCGSAASDVCDATDHCAGTSATCVDATLVGVECRASMGGCDPAEVCLGDSHACPPDQIAPTGTVCRASTAVCDPAESCDGTGSACPSDLACAVTDGGGTDGGALDAAIRIDAATDAGGAPPAVGGCACSARSRSSAPLGLVLAALVLTAASRRRR